MRWATDVPAPRSDHVGFTSFDAPFSPPPQIKYPWQVEYRWRPALQFGLQGFGELGPWDNWAPRKQQSHRAGPMISGSLPIGTTDAFKYQAAFLKGSVYGTRGTMFSMRLQYTYWLG